MTPPERMNLFMVMAAYRSVDPLTAHAWARDCALIGSRHNVMLNLWANDALIPRTRSVVLSRFLDLSPADVLLWVDADMTWRGAEPPHDGKPAYEGDLTRLARSAYETEGIVGGIYPKRAFGRGFASAPTDKRVFSTDTDELIDSDRVGTGFMAIHRNGLQKISDRLPYVSDTNGVYQPFCMCCCAELDGGIRFISEDWALCMRAREVGVRCVIDAKPVLGHVGEHLYTVQDAQRMPA